MVKIKNLEKIVLIVNEIHHDLEDSYHSVNKLMHKHEEKVWNFFLNKINFNEKSILEIGTGTGFLPLFFLKNKNNFKFFVCTDISKNILLLAKKNILKNSKSNFKKFTFKKTDGEKLPFKKEQFDVVIMNSVMHHLPNRDNFFKEAKSILKKDGILIVGHEPNRFFYKNFILFYIYKLLTTLLSILGKFKFIFKKNIKKIKMINKINIELKNKNLIDKNLTLSEINSYIDFGASNGIDYTKTNNLFKIEKVITLNYLSTLNFSYNFSLWKLFVNIYEFIFSKLFKKSGGTYFIIYKLK